MDLQFTTEADGRYAATATLTGPYALHLERAEAGPLALYQRHGGDGLWAACRLPGEMGANAQAVVDESFDHGVYPVEVRIVSQPAVSRGLIQESDSQTPDAGEGDEP